MSRGYSLARRKDIIKAATPLETHLHRQSLPRVEHHIELDAHLYPVPFGASSDRSGTCARTRLFYIDRGALSSAKLGEPISELYHDTTTTTQRDDLPPWRFPLPLHHRLRQAHPGLAMEHLRRHLPLLDLPAHQVL
jgi:hypothetical protein